VTVEVLDYDDVAMLDSLPPEHARLDRRSEALLLIQAFVRVASRRVVSAADAARLDACVLACRTVARLPVDPSIH
jgi:hypothetical protein